MKKTEQSEVQIKQPRKKAWLAPDAAQLDTSTDDRIVLELPPLPKKVTESSNPAPTPAGHKPKLTLRLAFGMAGALAIILGLMGVYSINHSILPVQIANLAPTHDLGSTSLRTSLKSAVANYRLTIQSPDGAKKSYRLDEIGLSVDVSDTLVVAQNTRSLKFWRPIHVPIVLMSSPQKFQKFVQTRASIPSTPPTDAKLVISAGKTSITAEQPGYGYRIADAATTLVQHAGDLDTTPLRLSKGSIAPSTTSASLQALQDKANTVLGQSINLSIHNKTVSASPSDIGAWLTVEANHSGKFMLKTDQSAIKSYLEQQATPYTTAKLDTVIPTGDGSTVQIVQQRGDAAISNEQALTDAISAHLLDAKGQNLSMQISGTAGKTITAQAQSKWLLVNLTTKRMYAYENTSLVRSFLISAGAYATPTVVGTYKIYAKYGSQDMRGENADGTNYFQPHVPYVNYFYKDYAVHGNYWRPTSYFGNVNSSHGCVGIVEDDAKWVYNWAPIGTTVMTHI